ncbi:MAG TPA: hypothetical protein VKG26_15420 [Bacteroidia bacterium]|nr:hypothetical protein [Bacteroidia bacterium]
MKAEDLIHQVEGVAVAVVPENIEDQNGWMVYLVNLKNSSLENVIVSSKGYGEIDNRNLKTSTLRHFIEKVEPHAFSKIEPIMEDVFGLANEYWVSFYINKTIYDKKFVFLPESIQENNFVTIPFLNKKGVMIK